mgnify:CR=1 FL=1
MTTKVIQHCEDANLATPSNSSGFTLAFIRNLPAYRKGLSANRRGLEVGMAHGYFLYGPFAILNPLRNTEQAAVTGVIATIGLISILTIALSMYAERSSKKPLATITAPEAPENLGTSEGWSEFANGFFMGGCGGGFFAYLLCQTPHVELLQEVVKGVWSVH